MQIGLMRSSRRRSWRDEALAEIFNSTCRWRRKRCTTLSIAFWRNSSVSASARGLRPHPRRPEHANFFITQNLREEGQERFDPSANPRRSARRTQRAMQEAATPRLAQRAAGRWGARSTCRWRCTACKTSSTRSNCLRSPPFWARPCIPSCLRGDRGGAGLDVRSHHAPAAGRAAAPIVRRQTG